MTHSFFQVKKEEMGGARNMRREREKRVQSFSQNF
jgi:hypothetical protein